MISEGWQIPRDHPWIVACGNTPVEIDSGNNKIKDGDRGVGRITRRAIYYVICGLFVATVGKSVIEDQIRLLESTCAVLIF